MGADLPFSEDCLFLNVYAPALRHSTQLLPVMIWIHGGSFTSGTAMLPMYNGSDLSSAQDVVVVPINYRLNIFGFAVIPEDQGLVGANIGLRDQHQAMRWVQQHIAPFGGDPKKVTIFGESAGGASVCYHYLNGRLNDGLFHRAISQSPLITQISVVATIEDVKKDTAAAAERLGCADMGLLACLRSVSPEALLNASNGTSKGPVIDGDMIEADPLDVVAAGNFSDVPLVLGNNADEGNLWIYPPVLDAFGGLSTVTTEDLHCGAEYVWTADVAARVLKLYPAVATPGVDNTYVLGEMLGDVMFHCDNRRFVRALSASGSDPWVYNWKHAPTCHPLAPGAFHSSEINSVFRHPFLNVTGAATACEPVPEERALSDAVAALWAGFARNGLMEESWPRFHTPSREIHLKLDLGLVTVADIETGYRRGQCDIVDDLALDTLQGYSWLTFTSICQKERLSAEDKSLDISV